MPELVTNPPVTIPGFCWGATVHRQAPSEPRGQRCVSLRCTHPTAGRDV